MKRAFRFHLALAIVGFLLTFFISQSTNIMSTSLIRGLVSGALLFLLGIAVQWILGVVSKPVEPGNSSALPEERIEGGGIGQFLDLSTPDQDEELNRLIKQPEPAESSFEPLKPPKLATKKDQTTQQLADALRTMSEE